MEFKFFKRRKKEATPSVRFLREGKNLPVVKSESLLRLALRNHIEIHHSCGGNGTCGTCRVFVRSGAEKLPKRGALETERAEERGFAPEERLACQIPAIADLEIETP